MKFKAIIFDLFGVVANEIGIAWLKRKFGEETAVEIEVKYGPQVDSEEITEKEYFSILGELSKEDPNRIHNEWYESIKINKDVVKLINQLKKNGYKTVLLSNSYRKLFNHIMNENNLTYLFDEVVTSFEEKLIKPDPRIFRVALNRLNLKPEEVIFIDDREKNVRASEQLGIKSILFKDIETLETELKNLDINL